VANEQVTVRFAAEIQQYQANVKQAQKLLQMFGISAEQEANRVSKSVASMVAQYASLTLAMNTVKNVIKEGINFNKFTEVSTAAFGTMLKSVSGAKVVMEDLFKFAVNSPLTFKETVAASRQMMAYGFTVKELIPTIQMLGTVGKATGVALDDMAYVYGTLRSQGRAYTRDLMQFAMRGIPIYEELAKVMGVPVAQLQKMTEAGKIGFKEVEKAFQNMTSGSGKFAGYFDEYMKTFEGKMSMLTDISQQASGTLTENLFNVLKKNVDDFIKILGSNKSTIASIGTDLGKLASGFFDIVKALIPLVPLLLKLIPLLIAKELLSGGLKVWRALPEIFNALSGAVAMASTNIALLASGQASTTLLGLNSTVAMLGRSFTLLGTAITQALPAILAAAAPIAAIVAGVAAIIALKSKSDSMLEKYKTDKTYTTSMFTVQTTGLNYTKTFDTAKQVQIVGQLQKTYSSLNTQELAQILFTQKAISKEAYDQIVLQATAIPDAVKLSDAKQKEYAAAKANTDILKQQAALISESMNVPMEKFQVKDFTYNYYGADAANAFVKGFQDAATASDDLYKSLGIIPPKADIKKAAQEELDTIVEVVGKLKSALGEDGKLLFPDITKNSLFAVLAAEAQRLQKILEELKTTSDDFVHEKGYGFSSGNKLHPYEHVKGDMPNLESLQGSKLHPIDTEVESWVTVMAKAFDYLTKGSADFWDQYKAGMVMAIKNNDIRGILQNGAMLGLQGTYAGQVVQGYKARQTGGEGNGPMGTGKNLAITSIMVLIDAFSSLGKFIWDIVMAAEPMTNLLKAITTSVSYALMPVIETLANGLSWLYDSIIVPVGNFIIDIINAIIKFVNKIFGTHINTMNRLLTTTEALAKAQEEAAKQTKLKTSMDGLSQTLDYLKGRLNDAIDSQVKSLQDLYEVGAISATDYQAQIGSLNAQRPETFENLVTIADQQLSTMQEVSARIQALLGVQTFLKDNPDKTVAEQTAILAAAGIASTIQPVLTSIAQLTMDATSLQANIASVVATMTSAWANAPSGIPGLTNAQKEALDKQVADILANIPNIGPLNIRIPLASGTGEVPQDMSATVHKGEMVIPRDFSAAIRRGDLSLSSGGSRGGGDIFNITIEGTVTSERDLVTAISKGIEKQKKWGYA
jgi:tape measure domain-containing protein